MQSVWILYHLKFLHFGAKIQMYLLINLYFENKRDIENDGKNNRKS